MSLFSVGITKYSKLGTLLRKACLAQSIEGCRHQEEALGKYSRSLKFAVRMFPERVSGKTHSECGQSVPQRESCDGIRGRWKPAHLGAFPFCFLASLGRAFPSFLKLLLLDTLLKVQLHLSPVR